MNVEAVRQSLSSPPFGELDRHFAMYMGRLAGVESAELILAAGLVSLKRAQGDICVDLARLAGTVVAGDPPEPDEALCCPALEDWLAALKATSVVGAPGEAKPLILDERARLYLKRYRDYEQSLADAILNRARQRAEPVDPSRLRNGLSRLFPARRGGGTDWQKVAAFAAVRNRFCVISGGPGTGKTRTVVLLLALLIEQAGERRLRVALAAPTGKAAARLQESIKSAKADLACPEAVKARLPEEAMTVHRLLGTIPDSPYFRHHAANPLAVEVLVVDEASMVDLALMAKLFQALPATARVILLGDKDQLASVEAGAVLADLCPTGRLNHFSEAFVRECPAVTGETLETREEPGQPGALRDCIVQLQENYRFKPTSGIFVLSQAVNSGDAAEAQAVLTGHDRQEGSLTWTPLPSHGWLKERLREKVLTGFGECVRTREPAVALRLLNRFRILCAVREGPYGVDHVNSVVEEILRDEGWIGESGPGYAGRPVLVTCNDYHLRLFNGDTGIFLPEAQTGQLRAFFFGAEQALRTFPPLRLPAHETAYAMTVHKSQGSEFDRVLLILPDRDSPILTRELVYTAITRARAGVELWSNEDVFAKALARRVERSSGLRDRLVAATG